MAGLRFAPSTELVLPRSEEHTSELQSQSNLVCRLLLEKKTKHEYISIELGVANRPLQELETLIGFFVTMVPILTRTTETMYVDDLIAQIAATAYDATHH